MVKWQTINCCTGEVWVIMLDSGGIPNSCISAWEGIFVWISLNLLIPSLHPSPDAPQPPLLSLCTLRRQDKLEMGHTELEWLNYRYGHVTSTGYKQTKKSLKEKSTISEQMGKKVTINTGQETLNLKVWNLNNKGDGVPWWPSG